jgi:hypothetical protein
MGVIFREVCRCPQFLMSSAPRPAEESSCPATYSFPSPYTTTPLESSFRRQLGSPPTRRFLGPSLSTTRLRKPFVCRLLARGTLRTEISVQTAFHEDHWRRLSVRMLPFQTPRSQKPKDSRNSDGWGDQKLPLGNTCPIFH